MNSAYVPKPSFSDSETQTELEIPNQSSLPATMDNPPIFDLPSLITSKILDYLDPSSLRCLRMVSQKTKSWVDDNPTYLRKLRIYLKDENRMEQIMESRIPWSNVSIPRELYGHSSLPAFLRQFHPSLKILKILSTHPDYSDSGVTEISVKHLVRILWSLSPQLESFKLSVNIEDGSSADEKPITNWKKSFKRNKDTHLTGLRELHFRNMRSSRFETLQTLVGAFFEIAPNLVNVTLPVLTGEVENLDDSLSQTQCQPLISYLTEQSKRSPSPTLKSIFLTSVNSLYGRSNFHLVFPLTHSTFLQLVKLCALSGTKLHNVPTNMLPPLPMPLHEKTWLDQTIASVFCINNTEGLENLKYKSEFSEISESSLNSVRTALSIYLQSGEGEHEDDIFELPDSLNLWSISAQCGLDLKHFDNIHYQLFQTYRPSVTKLTLRGKGCYPLKGLKLSAVFPNLKKLYMADVPDSNYFAHEEFLDGLEFLEDISLENCELNAKELVGFDLGKLRFLKSKRLTRLRLINCSVNFKPSHSCTHRTQLD